MSGEMATEARTARFEGLAARVLDPLQRYTRRRATPELAEDVVADTLLVLWRRLDDVPVDAELAWCYGVARGCLANGRRSERRHLRLIERLRSQTGPESGEIQPPYHACVDRGVQAALLGASDGDREVLTLWAWEGLEPREIAVVLGTTANAASIRLHRAKGRLRAALGGGNESTRRGHEAVGHGEA